MKHLFYFAFAIISIAMSALKTYGQVGNDSVSIVGTADKRIETVVDRYNRTHEINGYRIQIISSSKKESARKVKSEFLSNHQEINAYEIYQQPFFIVKVGDYLSKLEAEKFHREIKEQFPEAFVLPDVINPIKQYTDSK